MLKTFIKVAVCYPLVFKDEIVSVFRVKMSQLDTEIDKNLKILQFSKFYAVFLSNFQQTPENGMLERVNNEQMLSCMLSGTINAVSWCPVGCFEDIIAIFGWNWSQSTPKSIQQQKRTFFDKLFLIFVQTMKIFVEKNFH